MKSCCVSFADRPPRLSFTDQPRRTVKTNSFPLPDVTVKLAAGYNEGAHVAASFEETLAALFTQLQKVICRQHEIFADQTRKQLSEDFAPPQSAASDMVDVRERAVPLDSTHAVDGPSAEEMQLGDKAEVCQNGGTHQILQNSDATETVPNGHAAEVLHGAKRMSAGCLTGIGNDTGSLRRAGCDPMADDNPEALPARTVSSTTEELKVSRHSSSASSKFAKFRNKGTDQKPHAMIRSRQSTRTNISVRHADLVQAVPGDVQDELKMGRVHRSNRVQEFVHEMVNFDWVFHCLMNFAVLTNVIVLGFQAGSDWAGWLVVDSIYVFIFAMEFAYKLFLGGIKVLSWRNADWRWNWFDVFLLSMTTAEIALAFDSLARSEPIGDNAFSKFAQLRMLRIIRILRILRLSHIDFFKDLGLMVIGTIGGLRTLMWSMVMITVPVYALALLFTETLGKSKHDDVAELFDTVRVSMFTTFRCLVLGDCSTASGTPVFQHVLKEFGWLYVVIYCMACVCMSFGLFNVIVAIYVESTVAAAKANESLQRQRRLDDHVRLSCKIFELAFFIFREFHLGPPDQEADMVELLATEMSEETFKLVIADPTVRGILHELGVPDEDVHQLFEICDADGGGMLSLDEFVGGIRRIRGVPSRSDVVWIMLRVQEMQTEIHELHLKMDAL